MKKDFKFKVGDEVKTHLGVGEIVSLHNTYSFLYLVHIEGFKGHSGNSFLESTQDNENNWWFKESELELVEKPFKLDDLEVGYLVEVRNGNIYVVLPNITSNKCEFMMVSENGFNIINSFKCDYNNDFDIVKVYGHTESLVYGLFNSKDRRPIIWEEKEELFTLQCPITKYYLRVTKDNKLIYVSKKGLRTLNEEGKRSYKFTQKEINDLPNQEFTKTLVKEKVK